MSESTGTTSRAYASFVPTWQRFNISDGACSPSGTTNGNNGNGISPRSVADGSANTGAADANANPYLRQYSHVYSRRLAALRDRCLANASKASTNSSTSSHFRCCSSSRRP